MSEDEVTPAGGVPLAAAIAALRQELTKVWTDSQNQALRFRVAPVELTVQAAVTWTGKTHGGINWWLFDVGAEASRERAVTQTIKLTLDPVTLDAGGRVVNVFIDAPDDSAAPPIAGIPLDAPG